MNLQLNVDYRTNWGESLWVTGDIPALGCGDRTKALKLNLFGEQTWKAQIELPDDTKDFTYRYFVRHENGSEKNEWGAGHRLRTAGGVKSFVRPLAGPALGQTLLLGSIHRLRMQAPHTCPPCRSPQRRDARKLRRPDGGFRRGACPLRRLRCAGQLESGQGHSDERRLLSHLAGSRTSAGASRRVRVQIPRYEENRCRTPLATGLHAVGGTLGR